MTVELLFAFQMARSNSVSSTGIGVLDQALGALRGGDAGRSESTGANMWQLSYSSSSFFADSGGGRDKSHRPPCKSKKGIDIARRDDGGGGGARDLSTWAAAAAGRRNRRLETPFV
jgi:hypothetical protein